VARGAGPTDERFMRLALRLAARARGRTSPNPLVGAVVVRGGRVVGRGYHRRAGTDHAEVVALRAAAGAGRGADLYVNLEPCAHVGRTGPCARCVIDAGVRRVVVGMRDPNPLVDGKGIRALRRAGIEVVTGVLEEQCRELNEAFACYITRHRPFVTLKSAITLDGRVATRGGDSRWVTGEAARLEGHRLRAWHDAIIVGVGTVLADDPELTCRGVRGGRDPLRVVLDTRLRTPPTARVVTAARRSSAGTWIVAGSHAPARRARALEEAGARVVRVRTSTAGGHVDLLAALELLAQNEITSVLLEGGPTLAGAFWRAGLVDRVTAFVAPRLLGDPRGLPMLGASGPAVERMGEARGLAAVRVARVGEDVMITGRVAAGGKRRR
jgi:diaminohydroxyphosphoribosylaminopyrimidine deaminase/5-amino-6-(5-phosphoribosylamino)uracil reductase